MKYIKVNFCLKKSFIFLWIILLISIIESIVFIIAFNYFLGNNNILLKLHKLGSTDLMKDCDFYEWIDKNKKLCHCFNELITSITIQTVVTSISATFIFVLISKKKLAYYFLLAIPLSLWVKLNVDKHPNYLPIKDNVMDLDFFISNILKLGDYMLYSIFILSSMSILAIIILIREFIKNKKEITRVGWIRRRKP